jgi:hypothetical protein
MPGLESAGDLNGAPIPQNSSSDTDPIELDEGAAPVAIRYHAYGNVRVFLPQVVGWVLFASSAIKETNGKQEVIQFLSGQT